MPELFGENIQKDASEETVKKLKSQNLFCAGKFIICAFEK